MFSIYQKKMAIFIILAVFFVLLDRFLKYLAANSQEAVSVVGDWLKFNFARNYYIAFSIPLGGLILNIIVAAIISILLFYFFTLYKKQQIKKAGFIIIIIAGAMSNLYDRLIYGYVIDYFDLKYFTVFNIADIIIVGGVGGLMWLLIFYDKKKTTC